MNKEFKILYFGTLVGILAGASITSIVLHQGKSLEHLRQTPEYQFIVIDDSICVQNFGEPVGTVKLQGQLKKLINKHNE
jgi:hypothetical protein